MIKIKEVLKKNYKLCLGIIFGIVLSCASAYAASTINSSDVQYSNAQSGLNATSVQNAIDELNSKADNMLNQKIIAWEYNQVEGANNYCITGNEATCKKTECYKKKTVNSCVPGTIIDYLVNENTRVRFHVLHDDGNTITMQSQRNTIYNTPWYITSLGNTSVDLSKGPLTVLNALEAATIGWSNVNDLTYTMGTTVFKNNEYTGCNSYNSCTSNRYTMPERTAKARMITLQEASDSSIGCSSTTYSCPIWMYNYLNQTGDKNIYNGYASAYGSTASNKGYHTMTANETTTVVWTIGSYGYLYARNALHPAATMDKQWDYGARAVVEINKP